ncbi:MAG: DUF7007 domain-containing protein [Allorhizobium sp.]
MSTDDQTGNPTLYGRMRDGHLAALVGDDAFAMLPAGDGTFYLARAWRLGSSIDDWTLADFSRQLTDVVTEASFRGQVEEAAEHRRQLMKLDRHSVAARRSTPWGPSRHAVIYGEGVVAHATASHGGFALTAERNARIHVLLRADDGFYEEDCAWAAVAQAFPELFTELERRTADRTLRDSYPDAWEAIHGHVIPPGRSWVKDRRDFDAVNANRWIVTSAILSSHQPGFIECFASLGGQRHGTNSERRFLVPEDEYDIGVFGFVIDEARHREFTGPSDFIGWAKTAQP